MNKKLKKFLTAAIVSGLAFQPICSAGLFDGISASQAIGILSSFGDGMPAGNGATYTFTPVISAPVEAWATCETDKRPELDEEVTATCQVILSDTKHFSTGPNIVAVKTESFSSSGKHTMETLSLPVVRIAEDLPDPNNKGKMRTVALDKDKQVPVGSVTMDVTVDVYGAQTSLGDSQYTSVSPTNPMVEQDPGTEAVNPLDPVKRNTEIDGHPGTNAHPENPIDEKDKPTSGICDPSEPDCVEIDCSANPTAPSCTSNGSCNPLLDPTCRTSVDDTLGNLGDGSGTSYKDYIDNALGDALDSFNADDSDWADSGAGNSGESSLDDYFNGIDYDDNDVPGGLTDDVLGVGYDIYGEDEPAEGDVRYAEGDGSGDGEIVAEGEYSEGEGGQDGVYVAYADGEGDAGSGSGSGGSGSSSGYSDLASLYAAGLGGLDGVSASANGDSSNSGLLGGITAADESSLGKRLRQLAGGDASVISNTSATASDQELFDLAKNMLLSKGINIEDMRRGTNYAPNSAWTDPTLAWDFNRITTLLKKHKISLAGAKK